MRLCPLLLFVGFAVAGLAAESRGASPAKQALIDELLSITRGDELAAEPSIQALGAAQGRLPGTSADMDRLRREHADDPQHRAAVHRAHVAAYDRYSEAQLRELIKFLKSDLGRRFIASQLEIAAVGRQRFLGDTRSIEAAPDSKAQRTMNDIRSFAVASEAYAIDNNAYPDASTIAALGKLLSPVYIRTAPVNDAWGRPLRYVRSADKNHYRFVSGGADGKIDAASLTIGSKRVKNSDDIIFEDGAFVD